MSSFELYWSVYTNEGVKMPEDTSKNITLRVNSKTYDEYKEFCKQKGLMLSRQIEIFMEEQMADWNKEKEDDD